MEGPDSCSGKNWEDSTKVISGLWFLGNSQENVNVGGVFLNLEL